MDNGPPSRRPPDEDADLEDANKKFRELFNDYKDIPKDKISDFKEYGITSSKESEKVIENLMNVLHIHGVTITIYKVNRKFLFMLHKKSEPESEKIIKDLINDREILKEKREKLLAISRIAKIEYAPSLTYLNEDYHKAMKEIQQILEAEITNITIDQED